MLLRDVQREEAQFKWFAETGRVEIGACAC